MNHLKYATVVIVVIFVVCCEMRNSNKEYNSLPTGLVTKQCVNQYNHLFSGPKNHTRDYLYFHETMKFRIVGGKVIKIEQAPYQVMYGLYCAGSLIAPDWVITAAHCKDRDWFIRAGSSYLNEGVKHNVCAHFIHPQWFGETKYHGHDYDVQLLYLETSVEVTPRSRPIAIGSLSDIQPGFMGTVTGWGYDKVAKKKKMVRELHSVNVPIIDSAVCRTLGVEFDVSDKMFCAGYKEGQKDACQGDSGGPLVHQGHLIGIVSYGIGCALADKPGVYFSVPAVRDWIRDVTKLPL